MVHKHGPRKQRPRSIQTSFPHVYHLPQVLDVRGSDRRQHSPRESKSTPQKGTLDEFKAQLKTESKEDQDPPMSPKEAWEMENIREQTVSVIEKMLDEEEETTDLRDSASRHKFTPQDARNAVDFKPSVVKKGPAQNQGLASQEVDLQTTQRRHSLQQGPQLQNTHVQGIHQPLHVSSAAQPPSIYGAVTYQQRPRHQPIPQPNLFVQTTPPRRRTQGISAADIQRINNRVRRPPGL